MIAEEVPTMVLNYWTDLQAYRTDTLDGYGASHRTDRGRLLLCSVRPTTRTWSLVPVGEGTADGHVVRPPAVGVGRGGGAVIVVVAAS